MVNFKVQMTAPRVSNPEVKYYWFKQRVSDKNGIRQYEHRVGWTLVGGNGEAVCSSNQGFRDFTDAARSFERMGAIAKGAKTNGLGPKPKD